MSSLNGKKILFNMQSKKLRLQKKYSKKNTDVDKKAAFFKKNSNFYTILIY